ncbi:unnamed protein product [Closterium sp. Naga37s-1]|nr:unnamed protein product [Closterium sp. Naga37s-1]
MSLAVSLAHAGGVPACVQRKGVSLIASERSQPNSVKFRPSSSVYSVSSSLAKTTAVRRLGVAQQWQGQARHSLRTRPTRATRPSAGIAHPTLSHTPSGCRCSSSSSTRLTSSSSSALQYSHLGQRTRVQQQQRRQREAVASSEFLGRTLRTPVARSLPRATPPSAGSRADFPRSPDGPSAAGARFSRRCRLAVSPRSQSQASQGPTEPQAAPSASPPIPADILPALGNLVEIIGRMKEEEEGKKGQYLGDDAGEEGEMGEAAGGEAERVTMSDAERAEVEALLGERLPSHPKVHRGMLDNGLRYVILPNKLPPNRLVVATVDEQGDERGGAHEPALLIGHVTFLDSLLSSRPKVRFPLTSFPFEAHLEMYVGSVDEREDEQGLAHLIGHVTFLGFEAHLEMHVGSVDEREDEQGLAHLIEHVTFLGSRKREKLLGTGARSNAYTDFHHTVFHVHAPVTMQGSQEPMLPMVLAALHEIAFAPKFLPSRIDKERRAVLSEMQMMNTIEYRVDCQLLHHMHSENLLSCRFPIGQEEQVKKWPVDQIRAFHDRWYFPANATLYVVGDLASVSDIIRLIEEHFGRTPPGMHMPPLPSPTPTIPAHSPSVHSSTLPPSISHHHSSAPSLTPASASSAPSLTPPMHPATSPTMPAVPPSSALSALHPHSAESPSPSASPATIPGPVRKERHAVRPPVRHTWAREHLEGESAGGSAGEGADVGGRPGGEGFLPPAVVPSAAAVQQQAAAREGVVMPVIFQHELLQNFSLTMFCKNPVKQVQTLGDLRRAVMQRIVLNALQFRINNRYKNGTVPFLGVDLDHSDSAREGCTVTTLTVTAEPTDWQSALTVALQEVRRLQQFGLTRGELARYVTTMLRDSEHNAAMTDAIHSIDSLDFLMESFALGHAVLDPEQSFECLSAIAPTIELEDVNAAAAEVLEFVAEYGKAEAPRPAAIVVCVPTRMHVQGGEGGREKGEERSGSGNGAMVQSSSSAAAGAGAGVGATASDVVFEVTPEAVRDALLAGLREDVQPEDEVEVPRTLISDAELAELQQKIRPRFVPFPPTEGNAADVAPSEWRVRQYNKETGIIQRRLSNGIRVNMKVTDNEAKGGVLRLVFPGGRAKEDPQGAGEVAVGVRTLSEAGRVGDYSREQVELFCLANLVNCMLEADEECVALDLHFATRYGGLKASFQLLHMLLQHPAWDEDALERAKQAYLSFYRSLPKSLERLTASKLMGAMFDGDTRLLDPHPAIVSNLTLDTVRHAVMQQLLSGNIELSILGDYSEEEMTDHILKYLATLSIVGDFSEEEMTDHILKYLGTVTALPPPAHVVSPFAALPPNPASAPSPPSTTVLPPLHPPPVLALPGEPPFKMVTSCPPALRHQKKVSRRAAPAAPTPPIAGPPGKPPFKVVSPCPPALHDHKVLLRDTDERARAYIAGPAPNRWGFAPDGRDINTILEPIPPGYTASRAAAMADEGPLLARAMRHLFTMGRGNTHSPNGRAPGGAGAAGGGGRGEGSLLGDPDAQAVAVAPLGTAVVEGADGRKYWHRRRHPLYTSVGVLLLQEIVNARLFTTVRDALGLTYDVNFEISLFDRLATGWFCISVTSTPAKIQQAVEASLNVLRGLQANRITQRELDRAKRTLIMRHESDLKDNAYWLGMLTHLQCDYVPRKTVSCIADLPCIYEITTVDDVYTVYNHIPLDDNSVFTCIGVAGAVGSDVDSAGSESDASDAEPVSPAGTMSGGRGASLMTRPTA